MCLTPVTIKNPDKKQNGNLSVPCLKCAKCLNHRASTWAFRLLQEQKNHKNALFVTFTYADNPTSLSRRDMQLFFKRLRKNTKRNTIRYYACGEYGGTTQRPHYHAIIFDATRDEINAAWGLGHTYFGSVEMGSIRYVTNYMQKGKLSVHELGDREPEFSLMSKKLGLNFLTPQMVSHLRDNNSTHVTIFGGKKLPMPRYYRDKIYTKQEKKQLAEISRREGDVRYYKAVNEHFNGDHSAFELSKSHSMAINAKNTKNLQKIKRSKL